MGKRGQATDVPGIFLLPDGSYRVLATKSQGAKRVYRERTVKGGLADAIRTMDELRTELGLSASEEGRTTFQTLADDWVQYLGATQIIPHTLDTYKRKLNSHILPYWKDRFFENTKPKDALDWMNYLTQQQSSYAKRTLHSAWRVLCLLVRWASIQRNVLYPFTGVRFNARGKEETEKPTLTREELIQALDKASTLREPFRTAILIMATTGARVGEVISLRWQDFDLEQQTITICRSLSNGFLSETTKTKRIRVVPLHPVVLPYLEAYRDKKGELFLSRSGKYLQAGSFRKPLDKLGQALGLRITPHAFRRALNDLYRQADPSAAVARAMLGHTTPEMTIHYSRVQAREARRVLEKLDEEPTKTQ